jgi:uncharacterized protein (DUF934 family)
MPKLYKLQGDQVVALDDPFVALADDDAISTPVSSLSGMIVSFARFQRDGEALLTQGAHLGVRLEPDEPVEGLAYDLRRLALVALDFPKFRDGRAYSAAALLRERYGFTGEVRAVGDVLRDQALLMLRCGFDAFEPADGATLEDWSHALHRFRHVYQAAADRRSPAFVERSLAERELGRSL